MSYYTALITAWNGVTQPPVGVVGAGLTGGMTTAQKVAAVNGWTVTGTVPATYFTTGNAILNCINYGEFKLLSVAEQSNLLALCAIPGPLLGGSGQTTHMVAGMIIDYFLTSHAGPITIAALTALAAAQPWWSTSVANGGGELVAQVKISDAIQAGLS